MRLWTVHPKYLDAKGLTALWREGLLAKAVLEGKTRGYRNHPQLIRFRSQPDPLAFLCEYLRVVLCEAERRGYRFDAAKLPPERKMMKPVTETRGQLEYEWNRLKGKLASRDQALYLKLQMVSRPESHPLFRIVPGGVRDWEKV